MTATVIYTNTNLEETIKSIRALESKEKELKELRQEQEAIVKKFMDNAGVEELKIAGFVVRYTKFIKNQFDTSRFKKLHLSIYNQFIKQVNSSKFTIA